MLKIALEPEFSFLKESIEELPDVELIILPDLLPSAEMIEIDALLCSAVGHQHLPKLIKRCRGLKWIHVLGSGVDRFPIELVKDKLITCSRGATAAPISEWVITMMLAYEKQLPSRWLNTPPDAWYLADLGSLENKTLGLIGYGTIGRAVAKKALAFDMNVIAKVRTHRESPNSDVKFENDLNVLLSQSDHIVLALPILPETRHMLNEDTLRHLKPEAHLINVSRAELIDQHALRVVLDNERIGRASLDVVAPEPLPAGHWMYAHHRVCLSAHISWNSPASHARIIAPFFDNVRAFLAGRSLSGIVDTQAGY